MMPKERRQFLTCAAVAGFVAIATLVLTTQYSASALSYHSALGRPVARIGHVRLYPPWAVLEWAQRFEHHAPKVFGSVQTIGLAGGLAAFLMFMLGVSRLKAKPVSSSHGSARWADKLELRKAGLLDDAGVVLCQTDEARYASRPDGKGGIRWAMQRPGELIRHSGPEHVLVFAPTRSGKGIGTVVPTLLCWEASAVIYDIKRELWTLTAGWRRRFSHCWRFDPTSTGGVRYNPLFEIRKGRNEVRDAQNVAEILIDPDGKPDKDHWKVSGAALLTAVILHVLYAESDKSLRGVSAFLSDPNRTQMDTLTRMLTAAHLPSGPHPVVAQTARAMISKSDNELSGVVSTAKAALTLYDDEIVAENTATSDFRITDLMNADNPVSLYLVVPPSDIDRTRPLIRLMLQQFGKRLTERMEFGSSKAYRHRLLMLLDEFPTLGRLSFFETALAFSAGYGIKCYLICQSLTQLDKSYGKDNSIVDNCHVRMAYAANRSETAKTISDLVGQATASKRQRSLSGKGLLGARSVSESDQEFSRQLLTPDEVLRLPFEDAILLVGGLPAYRAKKLMYYLDPRFSERVNSDRFPPPESPKAQRAELLPKRQPSDWEAMKVEATDLQQPIPSAAESPADTAETASDLGASWSTYFQAPSEPLPADAATEPPPKDEGSQPPPAKRGDALPL